MEVDVVTVRRMRLAALGFTDPQPGVAAAVRRLLGVQAQDLRQAEWAIGSRVPGSVLADVWAAFDAGEVVRSWAARGTLFALAPADLRLLLALTAQRQMRTAQPRHRQLGLTDDDVDRAAEVARAELRGGGALTRPELGAVWAAAGLDVTGQRLPHLYNRLAQQGLLCLGRLAGRRPAGRCRPSCCSTSGPPVNRRPTGAQRWPSWCGATSPVTVRRASATWRGGAG